MALNLNPLPKNELAQWAFIGVTIAVGIITFIAMRHQIRLNKMQIKELQDKQRIQHPSNNNQ